MIKLKTSIDSLCKNMPKLFKKSFKYVKTLSFQEEPKYDFLIDSFLKMISELELKNNLLLDWGIKIPLNTIFEEELFEIPEIERIPSIKTVDINQNTPIILASKNCRYSFNSYKSFNLSTCELSSDNIETKIKKEFHQMNPKLLDSILSKN